MLIKFCQSMSIDQIIDFIEQVLLNRQLTPIERLILRQSWFGHTYNEIAKDSAYGIAHIKEIGSQLWHDLSEVMGQKVSKKNLRLVWYNYQEIHHKTSAQTTRLLEKYEPPIEIKKKYPDLIHLVFPGCSLSVNSPLYINRPPIEEQVYAEITKPGCAIRIKAPKKMGKTSLLNRIVAHAKTLKYKTVYLDFQEADDIIFSSLDKFLRWFCSNISRQLHINPILNNYWDEDMGSKVSCKIYFQEYLLEAIDSPLLLALNEVNRVFEYPKLARDFLPMLRFWHEQARVVDTWQKLRLVIVHATEIYIPLNINQSPFNVGLGINLPPFNLKQVQDLADRYGLNWRDSYSEMENFTSQLIAMVGGHPYLINMALYHLCLGDMTLPELLKTAATPSGIYSEHLRSHLVTILEQPQLASAIKLVVKERKSVQLEAIAAYKLESMGLVKLDGYHAKPSCELYRLYFREQLI